MKRSCSIYTLSQISLSDTDIVGVKLRSGCFSAGQVVGGPLSVLTTKSGLKIDREIGDLLLSIVFRFFSGAVTT